MVEHIAEFKNTRFNIKVDRMLEIKGHQSVPVPAGYKYAFVLYIDSMSCSTCVLKDMGKWDQYMEGLSEHQCVFYPIFSPRKRDRIEFEYKARALNLSFPLYVDTINSFENMYPVLKTMKLLNTFMVNDDGNVLIVGNPTKNPEIKNLVDDFFHNKD